MAQHAIPFDKTLGGLDIKLAYPGDYFRLLGYGDCRTTVYS